MKRTGCIYSEITNAGRSTMGRFVRGTNKRIMGFPDDYVLIGTQSEQKKYIGNAVEVNMARVLCEAIAIKI